MSEGKVRGEWFGWFAAPRDLDACQVKCELCSTRKWCELDCKRVRAELDETDPVKVTFLE